MPLTASHSEAMFEEDDGEIWKDLVSPSASEDLAVRLQGLADRLQDDLTEESTDYWRSLCASLKQSGFSLSTTATTPRRSNNDSLEFPVAFGTPAGQKHVEATCSLLQIAKDRAVQLTMSSLREIEGKDAKLQSLLGTRALLERVLQYSFQQRLARLAVLKESLRIDQDPQATHRDLVTNMLDSLDQSYTLIEDPRGLLRMLVIRTCQPDPTPTRAQVLPTQKLQQEGRTSWTQFVVNLTQEIKEQAHRERQEALEALLVLLYNRRGVQRIDCALLWTALDSQGFFASSPSLSQLAGLICAECMALWRTATVDDSWVTTHPLLTNLLLDNKANARQRAVAELQALESLLIAFAEKVIKRRQKQQQVQLPEALALLAYGLLLKLAHPAILALPEGASNETAPAWVEFATRGTQFVTAASDQCDAFGYLQSIMLSFTGENGQTQSWVEPTIPYDWSLKLQDKDADDSEDALSDAAVAYTSIGREILVAVIAAFQDTLLLLHRETTFENIGLLCNLAASIYQNNSVLCEGFWSDWETFSSPNTDASTKASLPLCNLMEAAYTLAVSGLNAVSNASLSTQLQAQDRLLPSLAPLLQFLSTTCHTSEMVESVVTLLPSGLIRTALLFSRPNAQPADPATLAKHRTSVIESIAALVRVGSSTSCRAVLRRSIEDPTASQQVDGPRVLFRLIQTPNDDETALKVLEIAAQLLQDATEEWPLQVASSFQFPQDIGGGLANPNAARHLHTLAASRVLGALVKHLPSVVLSESRRENEVVAFMEQVARGVGAATIFLSCSNGTGGSSYQIAEAVLDAFAGLLQEIRPVISLHSSSLIRSAADGVRGTLLNALSTSTGFGESIAYYATAPVSLSLALSLERFLNDASFLQLARNHEGADGDRANKFGKWNAMVNQNVTSTLDSTSVAAKDHLLDQMSKIEDLDLDLEALCARGWVSSGDEKAVFRASTSALRLLQAWASNVEDIVMSDRGNASIQEMDDDRRNGLLVLSPHNLLCSLASFPLLPNPNRELASAWSSAGISNLELMMRLVGPSDERLPVCLSASSLDLIYSCVVHIKCAHAGKGVVDSVFIRALCGASQFRQAIEKSVLGAFMDGSAEELVDEEKTRVINGLRGLRIVSTCLGSGHSMASAVVDLEQPDLLSKISDTVVTVIGLLKDLSSGEAVKNFFESEVSMSQLRVAKGYLSVIRAIWRSVRAEPSGFDSTTQTKLADVVCTQKLLSDLFSIVLKAPGSIFAHLEDSLSPKHNNAKGVLLSFLSLTFDILSAEIAWGVQNDDSSGAIRQLVDTQTFDAFTGIAESYGRLFSSASLTKASKLVGTYRNSKIRVDFSNPRELLQPFATTALSRLERDFFVQDNGFDVKGAGGWLSFVQNVDSHIGDRLWFFASYQKLLSNELKVLVSWRRFAEVNSLFWSRLKQSNAGQPVDTERGFFLSLARSTLKALYENAIVVERAQVETGDAFFHEETATMARVLADLFLFFVDMRIDEFSGFTKDNDLLTGILSSLGETCEKIFAILQARPTAGSGSNYRLTTRFHVEQRLLAASAAILSAVESPGELSREQITKRDAICSDFAVLASKVLRGLEMNVNSSGLTDAARQHYRECLLSCVSLITLLITKSPGPSSLESRSRYYYKLSNIFKNHDVISSLGWHMTAASKSFPSDVAADGSGLSTSKDQMAVIHSILTLILAAADTSDPNMLPLLTETSVSQMLTSNMVVGRAIHAWEAKAGDVNFPIRGYLPTGDSGSHAAPQTSGIVAGRDDPAHKMWRTSLATLRALVHENPEVDEGTKEKLGRIALDFLRSHRETAFACLHQCIEAPFERVASKRLTLNVLYEAGHLLSLVSELCSGTHKDNFKKHYPEMYQRFVDTASSAVASLSTFLGASGTSRELFIAISDFEAEPSPPGQMEGALSNSTGQTSPLLAGGVPNARHEAIRYSHFASHCWAAVTREDQEGKTKFSGRWQIGPERASSEQGSVLKLAATYQSSVSHALALRLEQAAAECISFATSILWKSHPARASFVMFSREEASRLDGMALVKPGMIIAYRSSEEKTQEWCSGLIKGQGMDFSRSISFARVISCSTVHRAWDVELLQQGATPKEAELRFEIVQEGQLAGIENMEMRRCLLGFVSAPETAAELEATGRSTTLGHLILVLRWCHQLISTDQAFGSSSVVQHLAEMVCALLGTELSLHNEIGSPDAPSSKTTTARIDSQLFDLFADCPERAGGNTLVSRRVGRLKSILGPTAWAAVRQQLSSHLQRAQQDLEDKEMKAAAKFDSWEGGNTRRITGGTTHPSPFRLLY